MPVEHFQMREARGKNYEHYPPQLLRNQLPTTIVPKTILSQRLCHACLPIRGIIGRAMGTTGKSNLKRFPALESHTMSR